MEPAAHEVDRDPPSMSGAHARNAPLQKAGEGKAGEQKPSAPTRKPRTWLAFVALLGVAAGVSVGNTLATRHLARAAAHGERAWHGRVARVVRSGAAGERGLAAVWSDGRRAPLAEGAEIASGMTIESDGRTRARLAFDDGSVVAVDRSTALTIEPAARTLRLREGAIVADVAHLAGGAQAKVAVPSGEVRVLGTKLAITADAERASVEVVRGQVEVVAARGETMRVDAAQEAVMTASHVEVTPANDLAQRVAFGEHLGGGGAEAAAHNEDADAPVSGLGELRARRPGRTDEKDRAVALAHHGVKIRIAGNVARTEIDETFRNDTGDDLEGIYRFPLPPGAQIERLALEVDGALVEGAFVDKAKGAAIWRGAIRHAAPLAPKPREEIVWVPGPWRDPALLEWQRGGRFELKIFPIPKRGARRVVLAYTETVPLVAGRRRYVYPLPQATASAIRIDAFDVDARVVGANGAARVVGYEIAEASDGATATAASATRTTHFAQSMQGFTPSGDLAIDYATSDDAADVTAWAYRAPGRADDDAYAAIALRPRLPRWNDVRPRDHVLVVDAGRAMFGERFARAKRLAVQIVQEMDRRDRVSVLACDVTCRTMTGGFVWAGSAAAHDVDAFLAGVVPDGASDLGEAVRSAAHVLGRDAARDLRVLLLSDGAATAGYRGPDRLSREVSDALGDPRAEVIAVPVGSDADATTLAAIARGSGGVVVPYAPGQSLETSALDVLNASYGRTLRDVTLTLPDGLVAVAPSALDPIRAGGEAIVTARMRGDAAHGDVVLRGTVGGEPFEARYPIDLRPTSDAGNAFVPRLYASAFVADKERAGDERARAEIVALSTRYAVPSRFTSLLVLESEAMFDAFGIDRKGAAPEWTGEVAAQAVGARSEAGPSDDGESQDALFGAGLATLDTQANGVDRASPMKKDAPGLARAPLASGYGGGSGDAQERFRSAPATMPAPAATTAPWAAPPPRVPMVPRGGWMKRTWARAATIAADASSTVPMDKVNAARAAAQAEPDVRSRTLDLTRLLSGAGMLDELDDVVTKWSARDPLDADAIATRADVLARRGDRDGALRVLGGLLASNVASTEMSAVAAAVARSYERAGRAETCAFRIAAAEADPRAIDALARAVACEKGRGRDAAADRLLASAGDSVAKSARAAGIAAPSSDVPSGDIVADVTWDSSAGVDLDVAIVAPDGQRVSWPLAARSRAARALRSVDAIGTSHEALAWSNGSAGTYAIELVRADGATARAVRGNVALHVLGQSATIPFVLTGTHAVVARANVRWEERLTPFTSPLPWDPGIAVPRRAAFDPLTARRALIDASIDECRDTPGPSGTAILRVAFDPSSGRVASSSVEGAFDGTALGRCLANVYRRVRVPPFDGDSTVVRQQIFVRF